MTENRVTPSLASTYVHLRDDRSALPIEVTPSFWPELTSDQRPELDPGRLVMQFDFNEDWSTWEMHPAGDEVVVLLSGTALFVLDVNGREEHVQLSVPGEFVMVPRGVWHTARIATRASMLFITPGEGTENRPLTR